MLGELCEHVLQRPTNEVIGGLYYMATIRANVFVCCAMPDETRLQLNVLPFEQSLCCECADNDHTKPQRVAPAKWAELLPYWLHRLTIGLKESGAAAPAGIYDAAVRRRLLERIVARGGAQVRAEPQRWSPPPLPGALLRPAGDAMRAVR